ncbi:MAG: hypothetical protein H3C54_09975 [Taibaiella sp.]|nr:hypothetical protein [Taibaiella sp.]
METEQSALAASLKEKLDVEIPDGFSEEEVKFMLEKRLGQLLERNPEEFFQMLYRIDIPERSLQDVLQQPDALATLADIVYQRQLQKVKTRLFYKGNQQAQPGDDELKW